MKFDVIEELVSQECIEAIKEEFKKYKIESGICDIEKFEKTTIVNGKDVKLPDDNFIRINILGTDFWDGNHIAIITYYTDDFEYGKFSIEIVRMSLVKLVNDFLGKLESMK